MQNKGKMFEFFGSIIFIQTGDNLNTENQKWKKKERLYDYLKK